MFFSKTFKKAIEEFEKFPGIGERGAKRFVMYILKLKKEEFENFILVLKNLKENIKFCSFCRMPFEIKEEESENLCKICRDNKRERHLLCIVEKEVDVENIENSQIFKGIYFILGEDIDEIIKRNREKVEMLKERIRNPSKFGLPITFQEIILALSLTPERIFLMNLIEKELKAFGVKVSKIAIGLPFGGEIEYADEETLKNAFLKRE